MWQGREKQENSSDSPEDLWFCWFDRLRCILVEPKANTQIFISIINIVACECMPKILWAKQTMCYVAKLHVVLCTLSRGVVFIIETIMLRCQISKFEYCSNVISDNAIEWFVCCVCLLWFSFDLYYSFKDFAGRQWKHNLDDKNTNLIFLCVLAIGALLMILIKSNQIIWNKYYEKQYLIWCDIFGDQNLIWAADWANAILSLEDVKYLVACDIVVMMSVLQFRVNEGFSRYVSFELR